MIQKLLLYKKGILRIRVTGDSYDRFLNLCAHHQIALWNLEYHDHAYEMDISIKGFRMLRPLVKKSRTRVRILKRHGLPFFLYRYQKRKMLFAGMLCGIILMYIMSCFLWRIDIEGNQQITEGQITKYLETIHIANGTKISSIDCKELAAMLRRQFEMFTWVSVKQEGTRLLIQVKENQDITPKTQNTDFIPDMTPSDLVSDRNGVITSMITRKGVPVVTVGDIVKKGDLLVKGVLEIFDDSGETFGYQYCHSEADIFIKTSYIYHDQIALKTKDKQYTGKSRRTFGVRIGDFKWCLSLWKKDLANTDTVTTIYPLCLFRNFYLPVSFEKQELLEYQYQDITLSKKEAARKAEQHLYKFLEEIQEKGVQISENNVRIEFDEKYCIAEGSVILIEKAGKSVERITTE